MKVLGLIASPNDPASRFRILQYFPFLKEQGIEPESWYSLPTKDSDPAEWTKELEKLTSINPWRTWNIVQNIARLPILINQFNYDLIWQSRMLLPYLFGGEKAISKPLIFDIDDAIWLMKGEFNAVERAVTEANEIFAGNEFLADWCSQRNKNVHYIPTTVDVKKFFHLPKIKEGFTIGWIGTPSNFPYLEIVRKPLQEFLARHQDARFIVVSSEKPPQFAFNESQFQFHEWSRDKENELVNEFDAGIMPLFNDDWALGKCGFKLLQYMACSIPIVATPVGVNAKLLQPQSGFAADNETAWLDAFEALYADRDMCARMGANGRAYVEEQFNTEKWSRVIAEKFKAVKG